MTEQIVWRPNPGPQEALIACPTFEVFFGGARGGGKTQGMLGEWLAHSSEYGEHAKGLMIRRTLRELQETIDASKEIYRPLGAEYAEVRKQWKMPNGATLTFGYLEHDSDAQGYQGHNYTRLYVEEIGNFPSPVPIMKLMASLRSGSGVPVGFRATGNPGGPGHQWVKKRYVTPAPLGNEIITDENGLQRIFIPSKVGDNPRLDSDYVRRLSASGSDAVVRAWLHGDWNVTEGAFFPEFTEQVLIDPFEIPPEWTRFTCMDWGYATPFAVYWFAVATDEFDSGGRRVPRGALVFYREWYGQGNGDNTGLRLVAEEIAEGIVQRETETISRRVIDPSAFNEQGGPSPAERINAVLLRSGRMAFGKADNTRLSKVGHLGGWDQMRARMKHGMMFLFSSCTHAIETIPMLQHDPDNPEDLDKGPNDHAADAIRYGCMSRPWMPSVRESKPKTLKPWREWPNLGKVYIPGPPEAKAGVRIKI